jgi:hypothetical protein
MHQARAFSRLPSARTQEEGLGGEPVRLAAPAGIQAAGQVEGGVGMATGGGGLV